APEAAAARSWTAANARSTRNRTRGDGRMEGRKRRLASVLVVAASLPVGATVASSEAAGAASGVARSGGGAGAVWPSSGPDLGNARSQPLPAGIGAVTARRLVERWAIRHLGVVGRATYSVTGSPAVAGNIVYYADWTGRLTAVDLRTGR